MGWTDPNTAVAGDPWSASDYNTYIRDNLKYVHSGKPATQLSRNNGGDYSTTSATFVDVDATNLAVTLSMTTGRALIAVTCHLSAGTAKDACLDVAVDGVRIGGTDGVLKHLAATNTARDASFVRMVTGLAPGSHTFKLQWKSDDGSQVDMNSNADVPVSFLVLEL